MPIKTVCVQPASTERRCAGDAGILLRNDKISEILEAFLLAKQTPKTGTYNATKVKSSRGTGNYSRGCRNSNPNRRISPKMSNRRTLATIGGVSLGMRLEEAGEGAGIVRWTVWSGRRRWTEVIQAPVALILSVFVSSINSDPDASEPRRNTGTWMRMRDDRRDSEESTRDFSFD